MFCNNCGAKINEGQQFCTNCGAEVKPRLVGAMEPSRAMPTNAKPVPWATRRMKIFLWVGGSFIVLIILAGIVFSTLNAAQQKAMGATSTEQTDGWQSYSSTADKFTVLFPVFPTYDATTDSSGDNPYTLHEYKAAKDQSSFWVMRYDYTKGLDTSDPDHVLDVFLNAFVSSAGSGAKLLSSEYSYVGSNRALSFEIDAGTEQMKGEFVLSGDVPYLVAYDYYPNDYNDTDYQKFISSFSLK